MQLSNATIHLLYELGDPQAKELLDKFSIHPRNQFHWEEDWYQEDPLGRFTVSVISPPEPRIVNKTGWGLFYR